MGMDWFDLTYDRKESSFKDGNEISVS